MHSLEQQKCLRRNLIRFSVREVDRKPGIAAHPASIKIL